MFEDKVWLIERNVSAEPGITDAERVESRSAYGLSFEDPEFAIGYEDGRARILTIEEQSAYTKVREVEISPGAVEECQRLFVAQVAVEGLLEVILGNKTVPA